MHPFFNRMLGNMLAAFALGILLSIFVPLQILIVIVAGLLLVYAVVCLRS